MPDKRRNALTASVNAAVAEKSKHDAEDAEVRKRRAQLSVQVREQQERQYKDLLAHFKLKEDELEGKNATIHDMKMRLSVSTREQREGENACKTLQASHQQRDSQVNCQNARIHNLEVQLSKSQAIGQTMIQELEGKFLNEQEVELANCSAEIRRLKQKMEAMVPRLKEECIKQKSIQDELAEKTEALQKERTEFQARLIIRSSKVAERDNIIYKLRLTVVEQMKMMGNLSKESSRAPR